MEAPGGWLGDVLQRIGYKGDAPPAAAEAVLDAEEHSAVRRALQQLGAANLFTQEELAFYKKLEADGKALAGDALHKAAAAKGLAEDVRREADAAAEDCARQRRLLDRWQHRCEALGVQEQQYAQMAAQATEEAAQLAARADAAEADLTSLYNAAVDALNAHEKQAVAAANLMASDAFEDLPGRLLVFDEPEALAGELSQLAGLVADRSAAILGDLRDSDHSAFEVLYKEMVRVHDAHVLSDFGLKVAQSEQAAAQAELDFLASVAAKGNPVTHRPAESLRAVLTKDEIALEDIRVEVQGLSRRLFNHLQAQPPERFLPSIADACKLRAGRLRRDVAQLEEVLFYQHQWRALDLAASAWTQREHDAVAALSHAVEETDRSLSQHIAAVESFAAAPALGGGASFQNLVDAADQTGSGAPASLGEFVQDMVESNTALSDTVARLAGEESVTTQVYVDAYRQLLECLQSRRENDADDGVERKPETYCEADLSHLKRHVESASEKLLDMIDAVADAKASADVTWIEEVDVLHDDPPMPMPYQYSNIPAPATPQTQHAPPQRPLHDLSIHSAKPTPCEDPHRVLPFSTPGSIGSPYQHQHQYPPPSRGSEQDDHAPYSHRSAPEPHPRGGYREPAHAKHIQDDPSDDDPVQDVHDVQVQDVHFADVSYGSQATAEVGTAVPPRPAAGEGGAAKVPSFLLRPDGTRMTPAEYKEQNMRLLQSLRR
eukprot:TRINITY_DN32812_c0_g1_i1.p1 TRINITY_DN32812_c0_g1~~TRINITY_DN32812_c0_g1_i1.p1  ORF type:complete len:741 (+),score=261.70 TRINITY_DN32812_c0_g1_i1:69-2225(+)